MAIQCKRPVYRGWRAIGELISQAQRFSSPLASLRGLYPKSHALRSDLISHHTPCVNPSPTYFVLYVYTPSLSRAWLQSVQNLVTEPVVSTPSPCYQLSKIHEHSRGRTSISSGGGFLVCVLPLRLSNLRRPMTRTSCGQPLST